VSIIGLTQIVFSLAIHAVGWGVAPNYLTLAGIVLVVGPTAWVMVAGDKTAQAARAGWSMALRRTAGPTHRDMPG
jgi:hypothetical protein